MTRPLRPKARLAFGLAATIAVLTLVCGCNAMASRYNNELGMMHYRKGNYAAARAEFFRAYADSPYNANYAHNLASVLRKQGDFAGSEQFYRQALNIDASHQPSYHGLAELMLAQNRAGEADELLAGWRARQPYDPGPHIETAWLKRQTGDIAGAEASLTEALRLKPKHPIALAQLGDLYQQTGRPGLAVPMYQRSLESRWNQPAVHARLTALTRPAHLNGAYPQMAFGGPVPGYPGGAPFIAAVPDPVSARSSNWVAVGNADPAHSDMEASLEMRQPGRL